MLVKAAWYTLMGAPTVKKRNQTVGSPVPICTRVLGGRRAGVGGSGGPGGGGTATLLERNSEMVLLTGLRIPGIGVGFLACMTRAMTLCICQCFLSPKHLLPPATFTTRSHFGCKSNFSFNISNKPTNNCVHKQINHTKSTTSRPKKPEK